jgi:hypothetical protein
MKLDFILVAKKRCLVGDPDNDNAELLLEVGDTVPFCKNWEVLEANGYVDRTYYGDIVKPKPAIPSNLVSLTVDELRDLLVELEIPPHRLKGSGKDGGVLKKDLIAAVKAA